MRMPFARGLICLVASTLLGCYLNRTTSNYDDVYEISNTDDSAILDKAERSEVDEASIRKRLEAIEREPEPVYRLNAGDQIEIRVYDHPDLGMTTRIGPDGTVGLAFLGQVKLSGLTIAEGAEQIRKGLISYVKNPVVSITLLDVQSETATIAGACARPGVYNVSNATRLADFYAMAGSSAARLFNGVDVDVADLENSLFVRNGEFLPVDFLKAINKGDRVHNIRVRKGDYIFIAQRMEASVIICGEVQHPHKRLFEAGMGLIEVLTAAGWMKDSHWSHAIIIRDGLTHPKLYKVDVDGILAGKCRNVPLQAGDIVYVPKDNLAEYNIFVNKLMPTAQIFSLLAGRASAVGLSPSN